MLFQTSDKHTWISELFTRNRQQHLVSFGANGARRPSGYYQNYQSDTLSL